MSATSETHERLLLTCLKRKDVSRLGNSRHKGIVPKRIDIKNAVVIRKAHRTSQDTCDTQNPVLCRHPPPAPGGAKSRRRRVREFESCKSAMVLAASGPASGRRLPGAVPCNILNASRMQRCPDSRCRIADATVPSRLSKPGNPRLWTIGTSGTVGVRLVSCVSQDLLLHSALEAGE